MIQIAIIAITILVLLGIYLQRHQGTFVGSFPQIPRLGFPAVNTGLLIGVAIVILIAISIWYNWPWENAIGWVGDVGSGTMILWGLILLLISRWISTEASLKKWSWIPAAIGLALLIIGIITSGIGKWTSRNFDSLIEKCLGAGNCPPPPALVQPREPATVNAGSSGTIMAPMGKWSPWYEFGIQDCVFWWGDDRHGNRFIVHYKDSNGKERPYVGHISNNTLTAIRVWSLTDKPEPVYYQARDRVRGDTCPEI